MIINHSDAVILEHQVRRLFNCDRYGISGLANSDYFEYNPMSAAIMIISYLYASGKETDEEKYTGFIEKYNNIFSYPEENDAKNEVSSFVDEIRSIVDSYFL